MSEELLPCPFCGESVGIVVGTGRPGSPDPYFVAHDNERETDCWIGMESPDFSSEEEAVREWNRRAPSPRELALVEAARDALGGLSYRSGRIQALRAALAAYEEGS